MVGHKDNNVYSSGKEYHRLIGRVCFACKRWKPAKRSVKLETYEQEKSS